MQRCSEPGGLSPPSGGHAPSPLCAMKLCFGGAAPGQAPAGEQQQQPARRASKKKKVCPLQSRDEVDAAPTNSCIVRSFSESTSLIRHCAATASAIRDSLRRTSSPPPPPPPPPPLPPTPPIPSPPPPPARSLPLPPLPTATATATAASNTGLLRDRPTRLRSSFSIAERVKDGTLAAASVGLAAHTPLRASFTHGMNGSARLRAAHQPQPPPQLVSVAPHRNLNPPAPSPTSLSSSSASTRESPRPSPLRPPAASPFGTGAPPLPPKQNRKPPAPAPGAKMPDPVPHASLPGEPGAGAAGPGGSTLTISELREIAARQQQQVESQQKLLRQREERLRQLRSQEEEQRQFVRANPQLHTLRDRVEQQELQLRRLRSLRGQMEQFQTNNENLASELTMIQSLCSEKERELAACIRKVNQLAAQMADLARSKPQPQQQQPPPPLSNGGSPLAVEAKRRELQLRYPVPLGAKLLEQSQQLQARQSEADHLDRRIGELRQRLQLRQRQAGPGPGPASGPAPSGPSSGPEAPVPLNGEPVAAFLQRQADAGSSTGSSSNSSLFSGSPGGAQGPQAGAGPGARPQPRYASRSVIQDTYTRRPLCSGPNLERYKSRAHEIYRANLAQLNVDKLSARTNTPRQVLMAQQRRHRHSSSGGDDVTPTPSACSTPLPEAEDAPGPGPGPEVGAQVDSGTEESSSSSQVEPPPVSPPRSPAVSAASKKSCLKAEGGPRSPLNVTFEPLYLLLDGSLEGEMEVVKRAATQIDDVSACTEEGITALHTAICAGQDEVVEFLVKFGANVNAVDADGWAPLHCAASCNNVGFVRLLVEHGAAIFLRTLSDYESPLEKCESDEDTGCAECLYNYQERLGVANNAVAYAAFPYDATNEDELSFRLNDSLTVLRKGDANEKEWYWARDAQGREGYVPRNFLALAPAIVRRARSSLSPVRSSTSGGSGAQRQPAARIPSDHSDQTAL